MGVLVCSRCGCASSGFTSRCAVCLAPLPQDSVYGLELSQLAARPGVLAAPAPAGSRVPVHFQLLEKLGQGGMGMVYRALDLREGRQVALKLLAPDVAHTPEFRSRFLREGRAASLLDHPNICRVFAVEEHEDQTFMVMALCEGETLQQRLRRGLLPVPAVLRILGQLASALAEAHAAGIVHRDLKPGNVMLTEQCEVKLLDFGLAKLLGSVTSETPLTRAGQVVGTLAYMSPEQVRGEPLDERADLWSLGVLAYEMLTGAPPFQGPTGAAVLNGILSAEPRPVGELRHAAPAGLELLVGRLLRKQPQQRIVSAAALLQALAEI